MINVTAPKAHFDCVCSYLKGAWFSVLTNLSPDLIAQTYFSMTCPRIWCRRFLLPNPSGFSM